MTVDDGRYPIKQKNMQRKSFWRSERMPYAKCFKRDLAGKKSIFWIALRPELEGIEKDFKKN